MEFCRKIELHIAKAKSERGRMFGRAWSAELLKTETCIRLCIKIKREKGLVVQDFLPVELNTMLPSRILNTRRFFLKQKNYCLKISLRLVFSLFNLLTLNSQAFTGRKLDCLVGENLAVSLNKLSGPNQLLL